MREDYGPYAIWDWGLIHFKFSQCTAYEVYVYPIVLALYFFQGFVHMQVSSFINFCACRKVSGYKMFECF